MRVHWSDAKWLIGIICVVIAVASSSAISYASTGKGWSEHIGDHPSEHHTSVYEDLNWLVDVMRDLGESELSMTAVGYGNIKMVNDSPHEILRSWLDAYDADEYSTLSDSASGIVTLSKHTVLSASVQKYTEEDAVAVVKIISSQLEDLSAYEWWIAMLEERLSATGLRLDWRLNLQTMLRKSLNPEEVWEALHAHGAMSVHDEEYHDARSITRAYYVPFLLTAASVRDQLVNVQAAVHQSTMDDSYRITLGTPLITIEY